MYAMQIAATSLQANQSQVDVIANNLANANTSGFKKSKVEFADLMYIEIDRSQPTLLHTPAAQPLGLGTSVNSVNKIFSQGDAKGTGRGLDFAIQGRGFFEVVLPTGEYAYTRSGHMQVNEGGMLVTPDGHVLSAMIQIPVDARELVMAPDGTITAILPDQSEPLELGRLELADFMNEARLTPIGDNLYRASEASGDAIYGMPGEEQYGLLHQGFLEGSNVNLIEELTNMMLAQRGYEMNAKLIQVADEMLGIANSLRR